MNLTVFFVDADQILAKQIFTLTGHCNINNTFVNLTHFGILTLHTLVHGRLVVMKL